MPLFQTSAAAEGPAIATQVITDYPQHTNPPPPPARIPKCKKGGRYKVPGDEFDEDSDDDEDHPDFFYGVVTKVMKTGIHMLFQDDTVVRVSAGSERRMPNGGGNFPKNRDDWEASEAPGGGGPSPPAGPGEL